MSTGGVKSRLLYADSGFPHTHILCQDPLAWSRTGKRNRGLLLSYGKCSSVGHKNSDLLSRLLKSHSAAKAGE